MSTIEKAIYRINCGATSRKSAFPGVGTDSRIMLIVTFLYIAAVISIPVTDPASLLWMACFPIIAAESSGIGYASLMRKSLVVLPFIVLIGIFNPILDREVVFTAGSVSVTRGWLTFSALLLRGLLSFQALLLLVDRNGFYEICRSLQWMHCPKVLVTQLLLLYRYIGVILSETLTMQRARQARGFGRKSYPLKMWGIFAGQLLLRSLARARRVHAAMQARGFNGVYHFKPFGKSPSFADWAYLVVWTAVFAFLRFVDVTEIIGRSIMHTS